MPSAYGFTFTDSEGNITLLDGYYDKEKQLDHIAKEIIKVRDTYQYSKPTATLISDPAIFKRTVMKDFETTSIADELFNHFGIRCTPAHNDIITGIAKVTQYLELSKAHQNPYTGNFNAPHFYVSDKCQWFIDEITDYYWKKDKNDDNVDLPQDKNDHAMDMLKYLLTYKINIATLISKKNKPVKFLTCWTEDGDYDEES